MSAYVPTGPADVRDQEWLNEQVADLGRGIEAARAIWSNWFDGRQVGRLHPGQTPGDYIASLGMRLSLPEALAAMPDASTRQVAAVAGVSRETVRRAVVDTNVSPEPIRGADGKSYPRVVREVVAEVIEETTPRYVSPRRQDAGQPYRVTAQAFERDARRLVEGYREYLSDERFAARYGEVLAALEAALKGET